MDNPLFLNRTGWQSADAHHEKDKDRINNKYAVYSYIGGSTAGAEFGGLAMCGITCTTYSDKRQLQGWWNHPGITASVSFMAFF